MSTAAIIVAIVCLLGALVSFAFIQQTVKTKREHKARLINALKSRSRTFKFMLSGFPAGFLPKDLTLLVQRSLADVCEQLSKLEPNVEQHLADLQLISAQIMESQKQTQPSNPAPLSNHQQIKEVKACLEELHKFVFKLEEKSAITRTQSNVYRNQIKLMVLQVSVDSYYMNGMQAKQAGKAKLAIHYFELALKLIVRESKADVFQKKVQQLNAQLEEQRAMLSEQEQHATPTEQESAEKEEAEAEWDKFSPSDDLWKKKNIYD